MCTPKSQFLQHLPKIAVNYNSIKNKQLHTIPCPYFLINLCKRKIKILFFFPNLDAKLKKSTANSVQSHTWGGISLNEDAWRSPAHIQAAVALEPQVTSGVGLVTRHHTCHYSHSKQMTGTARCWLRDELTGKTLEFVNQIPAHDRWWNLNFCICVLSLFLFHPLI